MNRWWIRFLIIGFALPLGCSSSTYYQKQYFFQQEFQKGEFEKALNSLQGNRREEKGRNRFLYLVDNGLLLSLVGRYEESNEYFEKAFLFGEDYQRNYLNEALSYWTNPMVTEYKGEDHEHLMVLYYKAMNFMKMGQPDLALIECRRLNVRLLQLSDHYESEQKYQQDAFIHTLMGIIYQSTKDYNNAFIAYRNALDVYENAYSRLFEMKVPEQLKYDLINTAHWTGFEDEADYYRSKFNLEAYEPKHPEGELIFFWHNGLSPIKSEWFIQFVIRQGSYNDEIIFANDEYAFRFPFHVSDDQRHSLSRLEIFRVAFPKYVERKTYYNRAVLQLDSVAYPIELAEDINQIAQHCLRERMVYEFSKGLLRMGLKKATEQSLEKEERALGSVLGMVNAATEHADTRNWQTLPNQISYARIPLTEGENRIKLGLCVEGSTVAEEREFRYQVEKGETLFHTFSSLESRVH